MRSRPYHPPGFTLLEVMVALMLSAMVMVGVRNVFAMMSDAAVRIVRNAEALDNTSNGLHFVHRIVDGIGPTSGAERTFGGDSIGADFATWCATPSGWLDKCRAVLTLEAPNHDRRALTVSLSTGDTLTAMTVPANAQLRYLSDPAIGDFWANQWLARTFLPRAIGIVADGDTVVLRIGVGG